MSSTQEKLRRAMMTGPNRLAEATINGKLVSYYEIHDETILLDLIDSAKREELIWIKEYVDEMHDEPLIYALQKRLAQSEQSEESE